MRGTNSEKPLSKKAAFFAREILRKKVCDVFAFSTLLDRKPNFEEKNENETNQSFFNNFNVCRFSLSVGKSFRAGSGFSSDGGFFETRIGEVFQMSGARCF